MGRPKRASGDYFTGDNYDVMIAITEGLYPWLSAIDIKFIGFVGRTTKGWRRADGDLSLDWPAQRLGVSRSGLEKSLVRLRRRGVIAVQRTPLRARYTIKPNFVEQCVAWNSWRFRARTNRFNRVLEILDRQGHKHTLDDVIAVFMTVTVHWDDHDLLAKLVVDTELRQHHLIYPDDPIQQAERERWGRVHRHYAAPVWKPWADQVKEPV